MGWQCDHCGAWIRNRYEGFDLREDYRRLDGNKRERSFHVRFLCRACAEQEWRQRDNPMGHDQQGLF